MVVESVNGYHVYYKLKEPSSKKDIPAIEKINQALAHILTGDKNATDASRILRVPDTQNIKYDPARPVKCVHLLDKDYDLDEYPYPDNSGQNRTIQDIDFTKGGRDASLFHVANCLIKGGMAKPNVKKILYNLAASCSPPFPENEVEAKIKSALTRSNRRGISLADDIKEWVIRTKGDFFGTETDKELSIRTKEDKANRTKILSRLCENGIIERVGRRRGCYRLVDSECDEINYKNADTEPIVFKWPLENLATMIEVFPGNIVVVAGVQNAGKSAFMLDLTRKNMDNQKIWYFSSEMGGMELRKRLLMFNMPIDYWDKCTFKDRTHDFADVIHPNDVNIIDYLEIHDNFYAVSGMLKAIHDKLDKGVAFVALQKNPGAETGLGGYRGLEKPRVYLNLDPDYPGGKATIVKATNWATNINPNGYSVKFKLISGCYFIEDGQWNRL